MESIPRSWYLSRNTNNMSDNQSRKISKYRDINDRFRQVRQNHRMTQKEMAELVGLSAAAVGAIEQNFYTPNFDVMRAVKRKLNVSYDYLIDGEVPHVDQRIKELEDELARLRRIIDKLTA